MNQSQQNKTETQMLQEANASMASLPSQEQLNRWTKQREAKKQKARDKKSESNAGIPNQNSMSTWYDEHGDLLDDAEPPHWTKGLSKAHAAPSGLRKENRFPEEFINKPRTTPLPKGRQSNRDRKKADLTKAGYSWDENDYVNGFDKVKIMTNGRIEFEETGERMKMHEFIASYC